MTRPNCRALPAWLVAATALALVVTPGAALAAGSVTSPGDDALEAVQPVGGFRLVSVKASGRPAPAESGVQLSEGARFVGFSSRAGGLLEGEGRNEERQVQAYVFDRQTGVNERVSAAEGTMGDENSFLEAISDDGRFALYVSAATNLVDDHPGTPRFDVYRYDRSTGAHELASATPGGFFSNGPASGGDMSADGSLVVFTSSATDLGASDTDTLDVFLRDMTSGAIGRISETRTGKDGDGASYRPEISADGSTVVFQSDATNLVGGDDNRETDIFRYDVATGFVRLVSRSTDGALSDAMSSFPRLSADGQTIAFVSDATTLTEDVPTGFEQVFVRDVDARTTTLASKNDAGEPSDGPSMFPVVSPDGSLIAFNSKAQNLWPVGSILENDVFIHDRTTELTRMVTVRPDGVPADKGGQMPEFSADATHLVLNSDSTNLIRKEVDFRVAVLTRLV